MTDLHLTREEYADVQAALEKRSSASKLVLTLDTLLQKWSYFVHQVDRGYADNVYEYTNDLSARDILQVIMDSIRDSARAKIARVLAPYDEQFVAATRPLVTPLRGEPGRSSWWWYRVPLVLKGELLDDLNEEGLLGDNN